MPIGTVPKKNIGHSSEALLCTKTCSIKIKKQTCLLHSSQGQKTPEIEAQVVVTLPLQALGPSGLSAIAM
jgi:hypothetical protein